MRINGNDKFTLENLDSLFGVIETDIGVYDISKIIEVQKSKDLKIIISKFKKYIRNIKFFNTGNCVLLHAVKPVAYDMCSLKLSDDFTVFSIYDTDYDYIKIVNIHISELFIRYSISLSLYVVNTTSGLEIVVGGIDYPMLWCVQTQDIFNTTRFSSYQTWLVDEVCERYYFDGDIVPSNRKSVYFDRMGKGATESYIEMKDALIGGIIC